MPDVCVSIWFDYKILDNIIMKPCKIQEKNPVCMNSAGCFIHQIYSDAAFCHVTVCYIIFSPHIGLLRMMLRMMLRSVLCVVILD